jgi:hypothetical protein
MYKPMLIFAPLVVAALIPSTPLAPLPSETAPVDFFPADTLAYAELNGTGSWLNRARLDALVDAAAAEGLVDPADRQKLEGALAFAGLFAGGDPIDLAGKLTAGGIATGLLRGEDGPAWGVVLESADRETLDAALKKTFTFLEQQFDAAGLLDAPHGTYRGADYWKLGDELAVGRSGNSLAVAPNTKTLQLLLDEAADTRPGLAGRADFAHDPSVELELWFDRAGTSAFAAELGEDAKKLAKLVNAAHIPEVQFLLGPGIADLGSSRTITAGLDLDSTGVHFELVGHAPESHTGLEPDAAAPPSLLAPGGNLVSGMLYRDVASIVRRSNELFAPEVQPKFSKALADFALLFGGMELDEELLPGISPWIEFTLRGMDFEGAPRPELALPGAAVVLTVEPRLKDTLVAGFQTTIGIANTDRAQAGDPPFTLGLALEGGILITSGHMPAPAAGEPVDNDFNLAPAAAYVDGPTVDSPGHFVMGTHEAVVRDLVRELTGDARTTHASRSPGESLRVSAAPLLELLRASRDLMAMQAVLEEGKTFDEATADLEGLAKLVELFSTGDVVIDYPASGDIRVGLELKLQHALLTEITSEGR